MSALSLALLSVGVFATTNIDDLFVLVSFFSEKRLSHWQIVLGQIVGIAVLVGLSLAAALAALAISPAHVGLLGFAPIVLGLMKTRLLFNASRIEDASPAESNCRIAGSFGVTLVTIASGGDNIGIYAPMFATQSRAQIVQTVLIFGALTLVWCFAARLLICHPAVGDLLHKVGPVVLPFVLIGLGAWILCSSGAIELIPRLGR